MANFWRWEGGKISDEPDFAAFKKALLEAYETLCEKFLKAKGDNEKVQGRYVELAEELDKTREDWGPTHYCRRTLCVRRFESRGWNFYIKRQYGGSGAHLLREQRVRVCFPLGYSIEETPIFGRTIKLWMLPQWHWRDPLVSGGLICREEILRAWILFRNFWRSFRSSFRRHPWRLSRSSAFLTLLNAPTNQVKISSLW